MSLGLLRAAWRPGDEVCVLRAVVRQREGTVARAGKLGATDAKRTAADEYPTGRSTYRRDGPHWPSDHPRHRSRPARPGSPGAASQLPRQGQYAEVEGALTGNWRDEHLFVLEQALAMYDSLAARLLECETKMEALLAPLGQPPDFCLKARGQACWQERPRASIYVWHWHAGLA